MIWVKEYYLKANKELTNIWLNTYKNNYHNRIIQQNKITSPSSLRPLYLIKDMIRTDNQHNARICFNTKFVRKFMFILNWNYCRHEKNAKEINDVNVD